MKISDLEVDGFGVWSGLELSELDAGLNVVFGPNESGKTTLLGFVRSMFYGFSPARRGRYLPPLRGGRPGGSLRVVSDQGEFLISRHDEQPHAAPDGLLQVAAAGANGAESPAIEELLFGIDEATFNNVFALGLSELQELGALDDIEAADLLYKLSTGLDRVSLVDAIRELSAARDRVLSTDDRPCDVATLTSHRARLTDEIAALREAQGDYWRLAAGRDQLNGEIDELQTERRSLEREARSMSAAAEIRPLWVERAAADRELAKLGDACRLPRGGVDRLEGLNRAIAHRKKHWKRARRRLASLRTEAVTREGNDEFTRAAPRVLALVEQKNWIASLNAQTAALEEEVSRLASEESRQYEKLGLTVDERATDPPVIDRRRLTELRSIGRAAAEAKTRLVTAREKLAGGERTEQELAKQMARSMTERSEPDLMTALERSGAMAARLRRRIQLDDRLEQLGRHEVELRDQAADLLQRQLLPMWVIFGLGALFVCGVVLILAGLLLPASLTGSIGWAFATLGIAGAGSAIVAKLMLERSAARRLDGCHQQLELVAMEIANSKSERESLEHELPRGGGPMTARLQTVEKELAGLEELLAVEGRRGSAEQDVQVQREHAEQARSEFRAAKNRWREALMAADLPQELAPEQLRYLAKGRRRLIDLTERLTARRRDLNARRAERDQALANIAELAELAGVELVGADPVEHIAALRRELQRCEAAAARREELRARVRRSRRTLLRCRKAARKFERRRGRLLRTAGVEDEEGFRRLALLDARRTQLQKSRRELTGQIDELLAIDDSPDEVAEWLNDESPEGWRRRSAEFTSQQQDVERRLEECFERRGRVVEQMSTLLADYSLPRKRLELEVVRQQLREAIHRWQVLATAGALLESVRRRYERERQPQTLAEASEHLVELTEGRYTRVWTPLEENVLLVDDADGKSLPVEVLSRGTREQLFLSLRLALAAAYARRGANLPLVLDDVLVNFDARRVKAAARVLRKFAASGHQLLVFTCHEHVEKIFKTLKVSTLRLPDNAGVDEAGVDEAGVDEAPPREVKPAASQPAPPKKPRRRKANKPKSSPKPAAEPAPPPEPEIDAQPTEEPQPSAPASTNAQVDSSPPPGSPGADATFADAPDPFDEEESAPSEASSQARRFTWEEEAELKSSPRPSNVDNVEAA